MKVIFSAAVVWMMVLACCAGCSKNKFDPVKAKEAASFAGQTAASSWLAISKPSDKDVAAVKFVVDDITKNLTAYQEGGFVAALPGIKQGIEKALPGDENKAARILAEGLAETLLKELDALFVRHPDWKAQGTEVAGIVAAFTQGASDSLAKLK